MPGRLRQEKMDWLSCNLPCMRGKNQAGLAESYPCVRVFNWISLFKHKRLFYALSFLPFLAGKSAQPSRVCLSFLFWRFFQVSQHAKAIFLPFCHSERDSFPFSSSFRASWSLSRSSSLSPCPGVSRLTSRPGLSLSLNFSPSVFLVCHLSAPAVPSVSFLVLLSCLSSRSSSFSSSHVPRFFFLASSLLCFPSGRKKRLRLRRITDGP